MKVLPEKENGWDEANRRHAEGDTAAQRTTARMMEWVFGLIMGLCLLGALGSLYLGFKEAENAITQIDYLALAAVLGIFARIAQAAKHREEDRQRQK